MRRFPGLETAGRVSAVALVGLALVACANPFADDSPTFDDILANGWLAPANADQKASLAESPLYCYGTIGTEDCHIEPLPNEAGRLVGYQGPPPKLRGDL
jgi:hypothetical protein